MTRAEGRSLSPALAVARGQPTSASVDAYQRVDSIGHAAQLRQFCICQGSAGAPYYCPSLRAHRTQLRRPCVIAPRFEGPPIQLRVPIPFDVQPRHGTIASPDFHRAAAASILARLHAHALLRAARSLARVLRSGIPLENSRWNRPLPNGRTGSSPARECQQKPPPHRGRQGPVIPRCSRSENTLNGFCFQAPSTHTAFLVNCNNSI